MVSRTLLAATMFIVILAAVSCDRQSTNPATEVNTVESGWSLVSLTESYACIQVGEHVMCYAEYSTIPASPADHIAWGISVRDGNVTTRYLVVTE